MYTWATLGLLAFAWHQLHLKQRQVTWQCEGRWLVLLIDFGVLQLFWRFAIIWLFLSLLQPYTSFLFSFYLSFSLDYCQIFQSLVHPLTSFPLVLSRWYTNMWFLPFSLGSPLLFSPTRVVCSIALFMWALFRFRSVYLLPSHQTDACEWSNIGDHNLALSLV